MELPPARIKADELVEVLSKCVVPLFGFRTGQELRLFGTGTLVQIGSGPAFLFTAGHVMDMFVHERSAMYVWNSEVPVKIEGDGFMSEPRRPARSRDLIDLAFLQITRETARALSKAGVLFADAARLSHDHPRAGIYTCIGYPLAPNEKPPFFERADDGRKVRLVHAQYSALYSMGGDELDYRDLGRTRKANFIGRLAERHRMREFRGSMPKNPSGMSGGAIFYLGTPDQILDGYSPMDLVGILTEADIKKARVLGANANVMADIFRRSGIPLPFSTDFRPSV